MQRAIALQYRKPVLAPCGACHYCSESVEGSKLFCDSDCRDLWQKDEDRKKREGKL